MLSTLCLKMGYTQQMANLSLREHFGLHETKSAVVSRIISATVDANLIKLDEEGGAALRVICHSGLEFI